VIEHRRKALVTGSSSGIGHALCAHLLTQGWEVVGWSRRGTGPAGGHYQAVDLCDTTSYQAGLEQLNQSGFYPELLIHAAGSAGINHLLLHTDAQIERSWQLNLRAGMWLSRDITRLMRHQKQAGHLLFFSTVAVPLAVAGEALYASMKAGIEQWVRQAAKELQAQNIRVNCLGPGPVDTPLWRSVPAAAKTKLLAQLEPATLTEMQEIIDWVESCLGGEASGSISYTRRMKNEG
jgi:3-oxoacyl-[acyl-carrier protein] reductase